MVPLEFGSDIGGSIRVPAHFCGVFGHKPSFDLVPQTGHAPPGIDGPGAGVQLGVIGPLARTAARPWRWRSTCSPAPTATRRSGYRLDLPPPRAHELRRTTACWSSTTIRWPAPTTRCGRGARAGRRALEAPGAEVSPVSALPDLAAAQQTYMAMLGTIISRGRPGAEPPPTRSAWLDRPRRRIARPPATGRACSRTFDVVLAPAFGTAAFPHTDAPDWSKRRLLIDGEQTPYGAQIAWAGLATFPDLPVDLRAGGQDRRRPADRRADHRTLPGRRTTIAVAGMAEEALA